MFLPPMTASADTTTPTPTRIKITDPAAWLVRVEKGMAAAEKDYDFQMFKATWFFPCNSAGLKFGFGPERVRS